MIDFLPFFLLVVCSLFAVSFAVVGYFERCKACNSWKFAFDHDFEADAENQIGYKVCKACGAKVSLGKVVDSSGAFIGGYGDAGGGDGGGGDGGC
jgi:hypothetical protein